VPSWRGVSRGDWVQILSREEIYMVCDIES
jgi:hypothetical protein